MVISTRKPPGQHPYCLFARPLTGSVRSAEPTTRLLRFTISASIKGIEVVEMTRNGTKGMCCGAGGARMWMKETVGTKVNDERALEAISTGASRVATACPFCYIMLDDGVKAAGKEETDVKVADIAIHLLDAIENGERLRALELAETPLQIPVAGE